MPSRRRGARATTLTAVVAVLMTAVGASAGTPTIDQLTTSALAGYAGTGGFADDSVTSGTRCMGGPSPVATAYRTDGVMVRGATGWTAATFQQRVTTALGELGLAATVHTGAAEVLQLPHDVPVAHVPLTTTGADSRPPVVAIARRLVKDGVPGASPNHLFSESPSYLMFPDGGPRPTTDPVPARASTDSGAGVTVAVYDTGLPAANATPVPKSSILAPTDTETLDAEKPTGVVDRYFSGHSVAISSVLHSVASNATVKLVRITDATDVPTDLSTLRRMVTTLTAANTNGTWPDVIVLPFGAPACDRDPNAPGAGLPTDQLVPVGLDSVARATASIGQSLIVASAGNESTDRRYYPAALDGVLAVGALNAVPDGDNSAYTSATDTGRRADFSNYGPWVDAWMPGKDLPLSYLTGIKYDATDTSALTGKVQWSGTSFAAPMLAALLAGQIEVARRTRTGATAAQVWPALKLAGRTCSATTGGGTALTLPTLSSAATANRLGQLVDC